MGRYDDIIGRSRPVSAGRPRMSMVDRGAQFSPFAALTGYEAVLAESARLTQSDRELDPGEIAVLNDILVDLMDRVGERPYAVFTCFLPDERKSGGAYVKVAGNLQKYDCMEQCLYLTDGSRVEIESIVAIET